MKIDLAIIGGQKCATTSLKAYLAAHPRIVTHEQMECAYFFGGEYAGEPLESFFPPPKEDQLVLLKHVGLLYSPEALARLKANNPSVKILICLRDPVARAVSAYRFAVRRGWETEENIGRAIRQDAAVGPIGSYLERSRYEKWVPMAKDLFGESNVMVLMSEALSERPAEVMRRICLWLGVDPVELPVGDRQNEVRDIRSKRLARLIKLDFPGRGILRRSVPPVWRHRFRAWIRRLNERAARNVSPDPELLEYLRAEFAPTYEFLARECGFRE